ncbi:hypothetical protein I3760_03G130300 [Carya illinoinensis]|uniref:Uncharacterized protein n=1 Tax=Carya illinoinensis TaxID=32201 RepID=A0A8T1R0G0_CARIL|nr:hypothetical protein I3760_03G130300 [Carya illinoinensis]KAG6660890.1 hypothetical protein CIPAW_03G136100 [Carya illinoinensis]
MRFFEAVLILFLVFLSFHSGESYTKICRDSNVPKELSSPCKLPQCNQHCAGLHPKGWGNCGDNACRCSYLCDNK